MILCFDDEFAASCRRLPGLELVHSPLALTPRHYRHARGLIVRLGVSLDGAVLAAFEKLEFVASITTGLDHIDLSFCQSRSIQVISLKGERTFLDSIRATPEHTWGLILALLRNIPAAHTDVLAGRWDRRPHFGEELQGKTLGIIGCGRVGTALSRFGAAFDMSILAFDRVTLPPGPMRQSTLGEVLGSSDVICVCLPLDRDTHHFISDQQFGEMRQRPWLVNTARGNIIDEAALVRALETGRLRGAAVDVLAGETEFVPGHAVSPLIDYARAHANVILTPHIAGSTHDSMRRTSEFIENKILHFCGAPS